MEDAYEKLYALDRATDHDMSIFRRAIFGDVCSHTVVDKDSLITLMVWIRFSAKKNLEWLLETRNFDIQASDETSISSLIRFNNITTDLSDACKHLIAESKEILQNSERSECSTPLEMKVNGTKASKMFLWSPVKFHKIYVEDSKDCFLLKLIKLSTMLEIASWKELIYTSESLSYPFTLVVGKLYGSMMRSGEKLLHFDIHVTVTMRLY